MKGIEVGVGSVVEVGELWDIKIEKRFGGEGMIGIRELGRCDIGIMRMGGVE